jgi:hypothetical protein
VEALCKLRGLLTAQAAVNAMDQLGIFGGVRLLLQIIDAFWVI